MYLEYNCTCINIDCKHVSQQERKKAFVEFWKLSDFDAQNFNLAQNVTVIPKMTQSMKTTESKKSRPCSNARKYFLNNKRVCKEIYLHTYEISSGRLDRLLKK